MIKQQNQNQSAAQVAAGLIREKILLTRAEINACTAKNLEFEKADAGVVDDASDRNALDLEARAHVNGASYSLAVTGDSEAILYKKELRRREMLKRALSLAEQDALKAQTDLGREIIAKHDAEIRKLHHDRALTVAKLMVQNGEIEAFRLHLMQAGGTVSHPLDGWSPRLFGTSSPPSPINSWPLRYLKTCIDAGIVTRKEIENV